ncbi:hypothetical protein [Pyxidicoccus xibeiensis]|uniref:hypothetical protein n=1 Tax=Pyxidicoccus xibeiensis TaxID=2906759 RepID=UPI0020A74BAF|nr:hypothetical protein [Pyxidicoccus xibeiensis]MCP3142452.1 hypothetical protein [Pyxidicoccus xibeiensis]
MKKMFARFGLLGLLAGFAGMSYSLPAAAAVSDSHSGTVDSSLYYYEITIIEGPDVIYYYEIYEFGLANPGGGTTADALNDTTFDN